MAPSTFIADMKLKTQQLVLLIFCLSTAWLVSASDRPVPLNTVALAQNSPAELYNEKCSACHGEDGRAKTGKGKRTGATDFTSDWNTDEERGTRIIAKGKGEMPSFKGKLTPEQIQELFRYVVEFRKKNR
jgi:cytochrome c6